MLQSHHVRPAVYPISCGVQTDQFHPTNNQNKARLRSLWCLPNDQTIFLYVGRLDWEKRPEVMLSALSKLSADEAILVLAGTGGVEASLTRLATQLGLGERVRFLGDVPHDRVHQLFAACDIFVMPGDSESLSIATLEAMASGLPVLAANSMALPELVKPGVNGLLFQPGSSEDAAVKMQWFVNHRDQWERMGSASMEAAKRHHIPTVMKRFEVVYDQTISRRKRQQASTKTATQWLTQRLLPHVRAIALLVFLLFASMTIYSETLAAPLMDLDNRPQLSTRGMKRILVISPHPDDLVLAAGGLLESAAKSGTSVHAVIVGNHYDSSFVSSMLEGQYPERPVGARYDYEERVRTTLEEVGISQITFLDFAVDQDPSFNKDAQSGQTLTQTGAGQDSLSLVLLDLFFSYSPEIILIPHPEDYDAGHRMVSQAARMAAAHAYGKTQESAPLLLGYLVNYQTYPDIIDIIDLSPLLPPAGLADPSHRWYSFTLSEEQIQTKRTAIQQYPFEAAHARWLLASYARPNELFTRLTITDLPRTTPVHKQAISAVKVLERIPTLSHRWLREY
jgi:LmbE family N-acetylglucosaminyl deacetylase